MAELEHMNEEEEQELLLIYDKKMGFLGVKFFSHNGKVSRLIGINFYYLSCNKIYKINMSSSYLFGKRIESGHLTLVWTRVHIISTNLLPDSLSR